MDQPTPTINKDTTITKDLETKSDTDTDVSRTSSFADTFNSSLVTLQNSIKVCPRLEEADEDVTATQVVTEMADVCTLLFATNELVVASGVCEQAKKMLKTAQEAMKRAETRFTSSLQTISNMGIDTKTMKLTDPAVVKVLRLQAVKSFSERIFKCYHSLMEASLTFKAGDTVWLRDPADEDLNDSDPMTLFDASVFDIISTTGSFTFSRAVIVSNQLRNADKDVGDLQSCQHLLVVRQKDTQRRIPYSFVPSLLALKPGSDRAKFIFRLPYVLPSVLPETTEAAVVDLYFRVFGHFVETLQFRD